MQNKSQRAKPVIKAGKAIDIAVIGPRDFRLPGERWQPNPLKCRVFDVIGPKPNHDWRNLTNSGYWASLYELFINTVHRTTKEHSLFSLQLQERSFEIVRVEHCRTDHEVKVLFYGYSHHYGTSCISRYLQRSYYRNR